MADNFVAEIRIFAGNFAPTGWATCDGQLLPISQNTALFSLLGTFYGGNGKSNFALPNLAGSVPMNWGQSSTGTLYDIGQASGTDYVTLLQTEMPFHNHNIAVGTQDPADNQVPGPTKILGRSAGAFAYVSGSPALVPAYFNTMTPTGNGLPHNNLMPYLTLTFCIALQGIFPARG